MPRLADISIPVRIAVACLLPMLAFTGFAGKALLEKQSDYSKTAQVAELADAMPAITNLIHELQKERVSSIGFVNSRGQSFADAMRRERTLSDAALAAWQQRIVALAGVHAGSKFARDVEAAKAKFADLAGMRSNIDSFAAKAQEVYDAYSSTISLLATAIDEISELTDDARIARQAILFGAHVRRGVWAGQERATGAAAISYGELTPASSFGFVRDRAHARHPGLADRDFPEERGAGAGRLRGSGPERPGDRRPDTPARRLLRISVHEVLQRHDGGAVVRHLGEIHRRAPDPGRAPER